MSSSQPPPTWEGLFAKPPGLGTNRRVAKTLLELLQSGEGADFTIQCQSLTLRVHRTILAVHSKYFRAMFRTDFEESRNGSVTFAEDDPDAIKIMIGSIYGYDISGYPDHIDDRASQFLACLKLLRVADKFDIPELVEVAARKSTNNLPNDFTERLNVIGQMLNDFGHHNSVVRYVSEDLIKFAEVMEEDIGLEPVKNLLREQPKLAFYMAFAAIEDATF